MNGLTVEIGNTDDRKYDAGGLDPDEHRHQQSPGPGQEGFHLLPLDPVLLFEPETIQGAQGKEGGLRGGKESHQENQGHHGQLTGQIGV